MDHDILQLIQQSLDALGIESPELQLDTPENPDFGDLSCNVAMMLSKKLGRNPRELAQEIIDALPANELIAKSEIAGPGFINLWLSDDFLNQQLDQLIEKVNQDQLGQLSVGKDITVITDSSHPNIAKPMGVHHLLSTVIGQAINNLYRDCGYKLTRDNYFGDWGTQFGKLIYAIRTWGDLETIKKDPIPELQKLYVKFHDEAEKHPELEDQGRSEFKKIEDGDPDNRELWEWIREISLEQFQQLWDRLGAEFDLKNGESFYEDQMPAIIENGQKTGVVVEGEGGSLIVEMDDENMPPCIIQKSDGATTYATRDLARIKYWQDELKAQEGIVVVDIAQKLHFDQVHESARKLGLSLNHQTVHFGRMAFPEGGMSTRKGKIILLEDVLDEAEKRALDKITEHDSDLDESQKKELARKMGIGAIKYNVLSQNRNKNYTFVWDQMLSFDGNSAPYLQYAYTRTQSLLKKAGKISTAKLQLSSPEEKALLKKLLDFEGSIERSLADFKPNHLCTYLFELAQIFSVFYNNVRILDGSESEQFTRLSLVKAVATTLKKGLNILGIEVPERM